MYAQFSIILDIFMVFMNENIVLLYDSYCLDIVQ